MNLYRYRIVERKTTRTTGGGKVSSSYTQYQIQRSLLGIMWVDMYTIGNSYSYNRLDDAISGYNVLTMKELVEEKVVHPPKNKQQ